MSIEPRTRPAPEADPLAHDPLDPVTIAGVRVEPRLHRAYHGDPPTAVDLEPKIMAVLVELARRPGEVCTREELITEVWNGDFVTEDVLTRAVTELRKLFDDDARDPRVIETIRKRGYRLIGSCTRAQPQTRAQPALPTAPEIPAVVPLPATVRTEGADGASASRRPRPLLLAVLATALVVVALALSALVGRTVSADSPAPDRPLAAGPAPRADVRVQPLTSDPGDERAPSLSPDGRQVVWTKTVPAPGGSGMRSHLWIQSLDGEPVALTGGPVIDRHPTFSATGSEVAFVRLTPATEQATARSASTPCELMVVSALGGNPRRLGSCDPQGSLHIDWSPDGRSLALTTRRERGWGLSLLDLETQTLRPLTSPRPPARADLEPRFSPDGRHVAFTRTVTSYVADVWTVEVETGRERRITSDFRDVVGQAFTPDGRNLIFSSNRSGTYALWSIALGDGEGQAGLEPGEITWVTGSGSKIKHPHHARRAPVLTWEDWQYQVGVVAQSLRGEVSAPARPLISSTRWDFEPRPSPDGDTLAFVSSRSGEHQIWLARIDGSDPRPLTHAGDHVTSAPRWSPDGELIAFTALRDGRSDLFVIAPGDAVARRITDDERWELAPSWTADGAAILYGSPDGERWRVWRHELSAEPPRVVIEDEALFAQDSPEGLLFARPGRDGLFRQPAGTTSSTAVELVTERLPTSSWADWVTTDDGIYYLVHGEPTELHLVDRRGDHRRVAVLGDDVRTGIGLSPDGSVLYYARPGRAESDLMVATNLAPSS